MFEHPNLLAAFGLTLFAGLATGIGSVLAFFTNKTNDKLLSMALGFSAGVMIYVSFMEILPQSLVALTAENGEIAGNWYMVFGFFLGIAIIAIIDKFIPDAENPHELERVESLDDPESVKKFENQRSLYRTGIFTALAIGIHNFPEGLATFTAALKDPATGLAIAIAIAIHNIPEGISVSFPIYYATGDKKKAFMYSFLSGLAEPAGAIVGYLLLAPFLTETIFGLLMAAVAGIMVFISFDELLPAAEKFGEHHLSVYGLIAGMGVMAVSLLLLM